MARLLLPLERIPGGRAFASLSRRVRALIVAAVVFVVLFVLTVTLPVPYVIESPGPTYNTLGTDGQGNDIIGIDGRTPDKSSGHLNLTTVSVSRKNSISIFEAVTGWLAGDQIVVPSSAVYPPGQSEQQTDRQNTADFLDSQDNAIAAASCELGYPKRFGVVGVLSDGAGHEALRPADVITSIDGKPTTTAKQLTAALSGVDPGTSVRLAIQRHGKARTESVATGAPVKGRTGSSLGITVGTVCPTPFSVDLGLGTQIGGPSAGLMFALGIMDKVGDRDLTRGRFIAGTGTIDAKGNVGAIGGIPLKMIAARAKGATVFLAPAGNCADVRGTTPSGLRVIKVSTLHQAVQDLLAIQQGRSTPTC